MTTNPIERANNLHEALRQLCGVENKEEAEEMLIVCSAMSGEITVAADSAKALTVLVNEWPE